MKYRIIATSNFEKQLKRLAKKFPSLKSDLANLEKQLQANPKSGTPLGKNSYKIRLAVKSKAKGKKRRVQSNYLPPVGYCNKKPDKYLPLIYIR